MKLFLSLIMFASFAAQAESFEKSFKASSNRYETLKKYFDNTKQSISLSQFAETTCQSLQQRIRNKVGYKCSNVYQADGSIKELENNPEFIPTKFVTNILVEGSVGDGPLFPSVSDRIQKQELLVLMSFTKDQSSCESSLVGLKDFLIKQEAKTEVGANFISTIFYIGELEQRVDFRNYTANILLVKMSGDNGVGEYIENMMYCWK